MLENLSSRIQGFLPTIVSAYQNHPSVFLLGVAILILIVLYFVSLPKQRRGLLRDCYRIWSRDNESQSWQKQSWRSFPGTFEFYRLRNKLKSINYNGRSFNLYESDLESLHENVVPDGWAIWEKEEEWDRDWLVTEVIPQRQRSYKPLAAAISLIIFTLLVWRVFIPAIQERSESRQQTAADVVEAPVPPTMPAPLAESDDVIPDPTPESEAEPQEEIEFEASTLVIDLSNPYERTPSVIEERMNAWISNLPTGPGPNIHLPQWLADLFATENATIISLGEDGFVIVSSWEHGLEYRRTDEQLNQIGDKVSVYGNCGTVVAGKGKGKLSWGVCHKSEWKVSKYAKGGYDIVVYDGGLVVDSKGVNIRWTPLWLIAIPLIALGLIIWRHR